MGRRTPNLPVRLEELLQKKRPMRDSTGLYEAGFRDAAEYCVRELQKMHRENDDLRLMIRRTHEAAQVGRQAQ